MENTFIISYDVCADGTSTSVYNSLYETIKSYGTWAHITESCWAVVTEESATTVRDKLSKALRVNDRLMVVQSAHIAAWSNTICKNDWLQSNL